MFLLNEGEWIRGARLPAGVFESHVICFCGVPAVQHLRPVELFDVNGVLVVLSWEGYLPIYRAFQLQNLFLFFNAAHQSEKACTVEKIVVRRLEVLKYTAKF